MTKSVLHGLLIGAGVFVAWRLWEAHQNAVSPAAALVRPFAPIGNLRRPGGALGPVQIAQLRAAPETRHGASHFN